MEETANASYTTVLTHVIALNNTQDVINGEDNLLNNRCPHVTQIQVTEQRKTSKTVKMDRSVFMGA